MIETERSKLQNKQGNYLSIGITEDGIPKNGISVPWENTGHAFNMKLPDVYISPEDLDDQDIMSELERFTVVGCYVWTLLRNYDFLERFPEIKDLSIRQGENIKDLEFLRSLTECSMLFLENVRIENLDVIIDMKKACRSILSCFRCVGLYNCRINDLSRFEVEDVSFSEFLVWNDRKYQDRKRFGGVSALTYRYYEVDADE